MKKCLGGFIVLLVMFILVNVLILVAIIEHIFTGKNKFLKEIISRINKWIRDETNR